MFKPLTRTKTPRRLNGGFAETQFLHLAGDEDYSGFAPTEMFADDEPWPTPAAVASASPVAARAAAAALERAAAQPGAEAQVVADTASAQAWSTTQWVAAQEAKAREAADQARAVIAAQRRAEARDAAATESVDAVADAPRTGLARLRAAFGRLLPGEFRALVPLCVGVSVTMTLMSAVLPMIDRH